MFFFSKFVKVRQLFFSYKKKLQYSIISGVHNANYIRQDTPCELGNNYCWTVNDTLSIGRYNINTGVLKMVWLFKCF